MAILSATYMGTEGKIIFSEPPEKYNNLALNKPTSQTSTDQNGASYLAVDGNTDGDYWHGSCSQTAYDRAKPFAWWMVDLETESLVNSVKLVNPAQNPRDKNRYLMYFTIEVSKDTVNWVECVKPHRGYLFSIVRDWQMFYCEEPLVGRYVRVQKLGPGFLSLCEVEVYGAESSRSGRA